MSLAIDAILIVVAFLILLAAVRKGLIRSIMSLLSSVASLIVAYAYTPVLAPIIRNKYLLDRISANIGETIKGWALDTSSDLYNLDRLVTTPNSDFNAIIERYGVSLEQIASKLRGLVGVGDTEVHIIADDIASPTSNILANVIAFIGIFVAAFIVLALLTSILDAIFKLPVLSGINKFFGFVFGLLEAFMVVSVLAIAISVLVSALGAISPSLFGADMVDKTIICKYLAEHNFFLWINNVLGA